LLLSPPPPSTLFPYTTLFRSCFARPKPQIFKACVNQLSPDFTFTSFHAGTAISNGYVCQADAFTHPGFFITAIGQRGKLSLQTRSEEHTSELQSQSNLVCRLL